MTENERNNYALTTEDHGSRGTHNSEECGIYGAIYTFNVGVIDVEGSSVSKIALYEKN